MRCAGKCFARAATKGGSLSAEKNERPAALSERGKEADKPAQGAKCVHLISSNVMHPFEYFHPDASPSEMQLPLIVNQEITAQENRAMLATRLERWDTLRVRLRAPDLPPKAREAIIEEMEELQGQISVSQWSSEDGLFG